MNSNYLILLFFFLSFFLSLIIFYFSFFIIERKEDVFKLSAYECGFDPFGDSRKVFDVRFYLISILFIVFDLEALFIFPWILTLNVNGSLGFWVMFDFFFELVVGFIYVWAAGALEWE